MFLTFGGPELEENDDCGLEEDEEEEENDAPPLVSEARPEESAPPS